MLGHALGSPGIASRLHDDGCILSFFRVFILLIALREQVVLYARLAPCAPAQVGPPVLRKAAECPAELGLGDSAQALPGALEVPEKLRIWRKRGTGVSSACSTQ